MSRAVGKPIWNSGELRRAQAALSLEALTVSMPSLNVKF
jgi:hypothetical protein